MMGERGSRRLWGLWLLCLPSPQAGSTQQAGEAGEAMLAQGAAEASIILAASLLLRARGPFENQMKVMSRLPREMHLCACARVRVHSLLHKSRQAASCSCAAGALHRAPSGVQCPEPHVQVQRCVYPGQGTPSLQLPYRLVGAAGCGERKGPGVPSPTLRQYGYSLG